MALQETHLKVVDVPSVVDAAHVLHQQVHLTTRASRYVDGQHVVPLQDSHWHLRRGSQNRN